MYAKDSLEDAFALLEPLDVPSGEIDEFDEVRIFQCAIGASEKHPVTALCFEAFLDAEQFQAERAS